MTTGRTEVLLGNSAIARGLVENGVRVVTSYPGTPASEVLAEVIRFRAAEGLDLYAEWSTNEKVALEVALAASMTGLRAAVAMKQAGLNVAADPLLNAAYTGVVGGLVVVVGDDPGPHSSQTEADTRLFALFAKLPVLDPSSPREAREMVADAFRLSEQFRIPVLLRPTTRVCHAVESIELRPIETLNRSPRFDREPTRWAATPRFRYGLHVELNDKLKQLEEAFETSQFNGTTRISNTDTRIGASGYEPLGIVASGVAFTTVLDLLEETGLALPVLKIGTPYPLPRQLVMDFVAHCERVLVLEEPGAAIELQIPDRRKVLGRLDGTVPGAGELSPEVIYGILARVLAESGLASLPAAPTQALDAAVASLKLPPRGPRLCPGCPHRSSFYAIKRTFGPQAILPSDIGCYTLGLNLRAVDTCLDMGAAISMADGFYKAYRLSDVERPIVATIGDSTFVHAGLPALANAVHTGGRFVLVILDNSTTAMTGMQPTTQAAALADGKAAQPLSLEELVRACGVRFVRRIDPYQVEDFKALLEEAGQHARSEAGGVAVVIAERACVLYDPTPVRERPIPVTVTEDCDGCKYCLVAFECPALVMNLATNKVEIDRRTCIDCGQCIEACYKDVIVPLLDIGESHGLRQGEVAF
jgi:indolepyruvate ferredoxin oxidoreductase alpha subunit